jgi:carbon-monoxide dehydrogenase medium subunit
VPLVSLALPWVGHRELRSRGTVCGSLAHADPAAELPAVAVALDAEITARGPDGERVIAARDFFTGPFTTALGRGELVTKVRFPQHKHAAVRELTRRSTDLALVAAFVADGRIAVAGAGPTPIRAVEVEDALRDGEPIAEAVRQLVTDPPGDLHAPAEYRREMAMVLVRRALEGSA